MLANRNYTCSNFQNMFKKHFKKRGSRLLSTIILALYSIASNAQWTTICNTGNGFVDNFENFNGELYATGFFNSICGVSCKYVAKYNGTNWQAVGNGFPNAGHHLSNIDGVLYGVAYQPNVDSNWVYKFDGTNFVKLGEGTYLSNAVPGFSQTNNLYNLIQYNGNIVACGEFDRVGNKQISGIMEWDGTQWGSLGSGLSGNITGTAPVMYPHDLCVWGTDLIVAGNFKKAGGQIVNGIARWDGTQWHSMGQGFNSTVYGICIFNGELYAGGDFTKSGATNLNFIAKWNGTNWIDPGFSLFYISPSDYSFIHTLKVLNDKLFVCGGFDRAVLGTDTMFCQGVASYNGSSIDILNGGVTGNEIEAIALYNGQLFVGGGPNNSHSFVASYNLPTAINQANEENNSLVVYPNPTSGLVTISLPIDNADIVVKDVFGKTILKTKTTRKETNLQIQNNGIYIIHAQTKNGTSSRKLIVH